MSEHEQEVGRERDARFVKVVRDRFHPCVMPCSECHRTLHHRCSGRFELHGVVYECVCECHQREHIESR